MSNEDPFDFLDSQEVSVAEESGPLMVDFDDDPGVAAGDESVEAFDEGQAEVVEATPEVTYFDPTEYGEQIVRLNSAGEDIEIPVNELTNGYLRQADYTRKTQEVAQQRDELSYWATVDQAMRNNPELGWQYLQQQFGPKEAPAQVDDEGWGIEPDPMQTELQQLRAQVAPAVQYMQDQQAQQQLDGVTRGLSQKYGDDFNATDVLTEAVNRGVYDPRQLETVYQTMAFERMRAKTDATSQAAATQQQATTQRKAAGAQAQAVAGAGRSAAGSNPPVTANSDQPMTVREAWDMAKAELLG